METQSSVPHKKIFQIPAKKVFQMASPGRRSGFFRRSGLGQNAARHIVIL
jgi:hypothetical protein